MEKPTTMSSDGSRELQCVGRLEIVSPETAGFLCGSIPVLTDSAFRSFSSALVPSSSSSQAVGAPRYQMLPTETDLNTPPLLSKLRENALPIGSGHSKASGDMPWGSGVVASNLTRKGEALAVSGLVEYGDEIDVIAPADILKQIFKMPYSKAQLSIAVKRIGQTLVMNTGPDIEDGEKLVRRHKTQSKSSDQSLFLNFAMHSVRMEACDCPPTHQATSEEQSNASVLTGLSESKGNISKSSNYPAQGDSSQFVRQRDDIAAGEGLNRHPKCPAVKQDKFVWGGNKTKSTKGRGAVNKVSQIGEKPSSSVKESEKYRRLGSDGFLRVMFWQFHNFRMLLGSDLLLFSNEKYASVSLHLWDVTRQVTSLTWLEAWLDNVMASVPELAICYHENGVVQGYELLKTDDIFLVKGISDDGTPAFNPHVVQQNGLSVFRFLQKNCKQDPAAYWLYKSAGEDVLQLFDLSVIRKGHPSTDTDDSSCTLPSFIYHGRNSLLSLGTLLYRIAHRLSLSMAPNNRAKCAAFFQKCLDFLDEPDQLVVRAFAHEQFARLILNCEEELTLTSEARPLESEVIVIDVEDDSSDLFGSVSESVVQEDISSLESHGRMTKEGINSDGSVSDVLMKMSLKTNLPASREMITSGKMEFENVDGNAESSSCDQSFAVCPTSTHMVQTVADPVSSKLAAVHHISQAIKSLRYSRQLQSTDTELAHQSCGTPDGSSVLKNFSICACGDADCIEVCDIREWLPTSKLDLKLWKLILLLGESYLALGQAYKEDVQLHQALKVVELACTVYGSMPQHLEDSRFISSMISCSASQTECNYRNEKTETDICDGMKLNTSGDDCITNEQFSSYLFWAKAWTLVGDVYVRFHAIKGKEISVEKKPSSRELRMSSEVVKEVKRLKKKLGQYNCNSCSLVNCSCQSDRASSGSSASSSHGDTRPLGYGKKQSKRVYGKINLTGKPDADCVHKVESRKFSDLSCSQHDNDSEISAESSDINTVNLGVDTFTTSKFKRVDRGLDTQEMGSPLPFQPEASLGEAPKAKNGGIFKYLGGSLGGDSDYDLSAALKCYEEAEKALGERWTGSEELHSIVRKKGWVCNELGRYRLERKELGKAEVAFADAIDAFKEVSDHTNIILINCNLGHGRRALAEEMVSKLEGLKAHVIFRSAYNQALENAKSQYRESLRYYGAARAELNAKADSVSFDLKNEVCTQFAHTYLRLGMLLVREDTVGEVYVNGALEDISETYASHVDKRCRNDLRKHEVSANDAIREALSLYESLGDLRKQEAAYAYYQLACYQRDCCLKFLDLDYMSKGDNSIPQRVKQYASLAERNWQKSIDFYGPESHPTMFLTILMERSALSEKLSSYFHSNGLAESALSRLLESNCVCRGTTSDSCINVSSGIRVKFWSQLQALLKKMLSAMHSSNASKSSLIPQPTSSSLSGDIGKLKELYKISLTSSDFSQLRSMQSLWES